MSPRGGIKMTRQQLINSILRNTISSSNKEEPLMPEEIIAARNRYFPGWYTYNEANVTHENLKPVYRVHCRNQNDEIVARRVQPDLVKAVYIYDPDAPASEGSNE